MSFLNSLFLEKEIKAVIGALLELEYEFKVNPFYEDVKSLSEKIILTSKTEILALMKNKNRTPRHIALSYINNISGDFLESGKFHTFRGVLNNTGNGYLLIFDKSTDLLISIGDKDIGTASEHKKNMRDRINEVG